MVPYIDDWYLSEEWDSLTEAKADQQLLVDHAGQQLTDNFFKLKDRLPVEQRDLYYWLKRDPAELKKTLNNLPKPRSQQKKEGATLLYSKGGWKVYRIDSYDAAKYYGENTKWCISGKYAGSESQGEYYFNNYKNKGLQGYYFILSPDPMQKWCYLDYGFSQYAHRTEQFWDALDNSYQWVLEIPEEIIDILPSNHCAKVPFRIDGDTLYLLSVSGVETVPACELDYDYFEWPPYKFPETIKKVIVEPGITTIKSFAFWQADPVGGITHVYLPNDIIIESEAFKFCPSLQYVEIAETGNGTAYIDPAAFINCKNLEKIIIPKNVDRVSSTFCTGCPKATIYTTARRTPDSWDEDWANCVDNRVVWDYKNGAKAIDTTTEVKYNIDNGVLSFDAPTGVTTLPYIAKLHQQLRQHHNYIDKIIIPEGIKRIDPEAFASQSFNSVTELVLPSTLTTIEPQQFSDLDSLTKVVIPKAVTSIGQGAFTTGATIIDLESGKAVQTGPGLTIYCEAESKPAGWSEYWYDGLGGVEVVWGCTWN